MSDTDTSAEAVERAVKKLTRLGQIGRESAANSLPITGVTNRDGLNIAATLCALLAERDAERVAREHWQSQVQSTVQSLLKAEAERDEARRDLEALAQAIVGKTGASAILTAPKVMARLNRAEAERNVERANAETLDAICRRTEAERDEAVATLALYRAENGCTRGQRTTQWCGEATKLRRAWLRVIQAENQCPASGGGCLSKRCGCLAEMEMLIGETRHD